MLANLGKELELLVLVFEALHKETNTRDVRVFSTKTTVEKKGEKMETNLMKQYCLFMCVERTSKY